MKNFSKLWNIISKLEIKEENMKYHLTVAGPKPCKANVRPCPIGGEHYSSLNQAEEAFSKTQEIFPTLKLSDENSRLYRSYRNALSKMLGGTKSEKKQRALKIVANRYSVPIGELKDIVRTGDIEKGITHDKPLSGFSEAEEVFAEEAEYLQAQWEEKNDSKCPVCGKEPKNYPELKKNIEVRPIYPVKNGSWIPYLSCFDCYLTEKQKVESLR